MHSALTGSNAAFNDFICIVTGRHHVMNFFYISSSVLGLYTEATGLTLDPPYKTLRQKLGGPQESWGVRTPSTPPVVAPLGSTPNRRQQPAHSVSTLVHCSTDSGRVFHVPTTGTLIEKKKTFDIQSKVMMIIIMMTILIHFHGQISDMLVFIVWFRMAV